MTHYYPPPAGCSGQLYRVKPGDTIHEIARRFGVAVEKILSANPQVTDPNLLFPGQVICIPGTLRRGYCITLTPEPCSDYSDCIGLLWMRSTKPHETQVMAVAMNTPDTCRLGASRYTCRFYWDGGSYELPMSPIIEDPVWFGLGFAPFLFPPAFFIGGRVGIFPGPILGGFII